MFTEISHTKIFMLAGNSTITIKSSLSGKHYTYRVKKIREDGPVYYVSLLNGSDNEKSYCYIGLYDSVSNKFKITSKSKMTYNSTPVKAFQYFIKGFDNKMFPKHLEVYHENKCGRCNRKLTTPESIESGFGPECIKLICEGV